MIYPAPSPVRPHVRQSPPSAFTLIELLTVIAIIGILAAIIIPVVGKVRGTAARATCISHMRQVGVAIMAFSNENKGMLPGPLYTGQGPVYDPDVARLQSSTKIGPYMGIPAFTSWGQYRKADAMNCPAWETKRPVPATPDLAGFASCWWVFVNTHTPMVNGSEINPFGNPANATKPTLLTNVANLSTAWMYVEADGQMGPGPKSPVSSSLLGRGVPDRPPHGEYRNAIFFDGHAGRLDLNYNTL